MDLSVIIVNWNSLSYLRACLSSIRKHLRQVSYEVIVVDNASPEGGVDALKEAFPEISLLKSSVNLGFAGANNLGFQTSKGEYLLFLNPDTELIDDSVERMLEKARNLNDAGVVGGKLLNTDRSIQISSIQKFPTIANQLLDSEYLQGRWPSCSLWDISPLYSETTTPASVEIISGACMLLKRRAFEQVGQFTEDYFMYAEDVDLCFKAIRLGLKNYYMGDCRLLHHGGRSSTQVSVSHWAVVMRLRAVQQFCAKRRGSRYARKYRIAMGIVAVGRLAILSVAQLLMFRSSRNRGLRYASSKWYAVLKWSCGANPGARTGDSSAIVSG